jgi:Zn-dependent M28 family amino/carboxypeptidase
MGAADGPNSRVLLLIESDCMKVPILFLLAAAGILAADYAAEGKLWWSHIEFLASDRLQGRNTGSEGLELATKYVEGQFDRLGLKPAGVTGYRQPVAFVTHELIPAECSLALVRDGRPEPLALGEDASLNSRADLAPSVEAPMVFVGYGMSVPEAHYDELQGLDLRGKIAVYVNAAGPIPAGDNVKSHYSSAVERWAALRRAGAIGFAAIPLARPNAPGGAQGGRGGRGGPPPQPPLSVILADPALQETGGQQIAVMITRRGAPRVFEGSGHTFEDIDRLAAEGQALPHFPLAVSLRAKTAVKNGTLEAANLAALLPGSDSRLKDQYVIMSAHLDHLGVGRPVAGDAIYNGAMDDASGIASVLEIARLMKESGARPKRSVLFLAVTAEEKGELGSRYFAAHPTVPVKQIVADINLDMFLPLYPLQVIEVQGLAESTLGDQVRAAAKKLGVDVQTDREPEQNRFIRSDQYSFIREGIPSLAFKFGYRFGSPEEKIRRDWVRDRYHKPSDDLSQPVDTAAAARFDRIIEGLLERVADDSQKPEWKSDSFFQRFAKK